MKKEYSSKTITDPVILKRLLGLKSNDITLELMREFFAYRKSGEPLFQPNDRFTLPSKHLYNSSSIITTVGRYVFNVLLLNKKFGPEIGYINDVLNSKGMGGLDTKMSNLLLDDIITTKDFAEYIDKVQWIGFSISDFINPPLTSDLLMATDNVRKRKEELLADEETQRKLAEGDVQTMTNIEKELLAMSKEELKDLPDMGIYDSGARGSFNNNYKMTAISRGPVARMSDPSKYDISTASLDEGIPPEEQDMYADIMANASYSRSKLTEVGG